MKSMARLDDGGSLVDLAVLLDRDVTVAEVNAAFEAAAATPELRGRIKIAAFGRGVTVADMLRELLSREFPSTPGDPT